MDDYELLEAASKVIGYASLPIEGWTIDRSKGMRLVDLNHEFVRYWNPLYDDGDTFRLAVVACFTIVQWEYSVEIKIGDEHIHREVSNGEFTRLELTRRAIVQAVVKLKERK